MVVGPAAFAEAARGAAKAGDAVDVASGVHAGVLVAPGDFDAIGRARDTVTAALAHHDAFGRRARIDVGRAAAFELGCFLAQPHLEKTMRRLARRGQAREDS